MGAKGDKVSRFESKYVIPRALVPEVREFIRPFCRPDPHARGVPPEYVITTLQLDNPQLSLHYAKASYWARRVRSRASRTTCASR